MAEAVAYSDQILRHAQSEANIAKRLVSNPAIGMYAYGITELGRVQIRESLTGEVSRGFGPRKKIVYICSPFKRTMETAWEARSFADGLMVVDDRLRERWMGDYDMHSDDGLFDEIWEADKLDDNNNLGGAESPNQVGARFLEVVADAREAFPDYDIVYVTHGDVAQIGLAAYNKLMGTSELSTGQHRDLPHMQNAEMRRL